MRPTDRAARIAWAGRLLYGERWQRALGRELGLSSAQMSYIVSGERRVTTEVEQQLMAVLKRESTRLRKSASELDKIVKLIESDEPPER